MLPSHQTERWFRKGLRLAAGSLFSDSLEAFDRALSLAPDYAPAQVHKALSLSALKRFDEALDTAQDAVAAAPANAVHRLWYGVIAYDAGRWTSAASAFAEGRHLAPDNRLLAAYHLLATLQLPEARAADVLAELAPEINIVNAAFQGRFLVCCETALHAFGAEARTLAQQLIYETYFGPPPDLSARLERFGLKVGALLDTVTAVTPRRREARRHAREGDRNMAAGELQAALDAFHQALALRPDWESLLDKYLDLSLYLGHGRVLLDRMAQMGDIDTLRDKVAAYHAVRGNPDKGRPPNLDPDLPFLTMLGVVEYHMGRLRQAQRWLEPVAASDPRDYIAPYFLGLVLLRAGSADMARPHFQQAAGVVNPDMALKRLNEWQRCIALASAE